MSEAILQLENITKSFDDTGVLKGIDLSVDHGEFVTLLGSSGCGKTTTLRIIAGLEVPDGGRVLLDGQDVTYTEPNKRDVNTVFQNYALFPHMTVAQNVAYSLRLKKKNKQFIEQEVKAALSLVQLEGYEKRMPQELSGGQMQRVAIARALVNKPQLLLLDEPLGALDLQLRRQMQTELKALQKRLGIAFIYITHDQEEALNMSDRIVVMRDGRFEQIGTPAEIYDYPKTSFVARFVGSANIIHGSVLQQTDETFEASICDEIMMAQSAGQQFVPKEKITLAIRSEHLQLARCEVEKNVSVESHGRSAGGLYADVIEKSIAGGMLRIVLRLKDGTELTATRLGIDVEFEVGDRVVVSWNAVHAVPVDKENPRQSLGKGMGVIQDGA
ncbi:MAG: ABC transporter ATP-binding protein [Lachnospiraceae bacterium]